MADGKILTVNLRKKLLKTGKWRRGRVAVSRVRDMLIRNSEAEKVVMEKKLSERLFLHPLSKTKINIVKLDDKSVRAELVE